jgi:N,N'-diacetyllegionaminate synthase
MHIEIAGRSVGRRFPLFVVAELGLNHNGSPEAALALVDAAADAGAAAVKLQTIDADRLVAPDCPPPAHVAVNSLRDFFRRFELNEDAHRAVAERAHARGLAMMSTPFSEGAVDMLAAIGCDALKIASGDLTHLHLVERAARTGLPVVLSTGMAGLGEVAEALACARDAGARQVALLHCVSAYPVPAGGDNLGAIAELARTFRVPVGLSDHGTQTLAVAMAVALGASIYERHFVLDERAAGVDAPLSSTPAQLRAAVEQAAAAVAALGSGRKSCTPDERPNLEASRRSLYAARHLRAGEVVSDDAVVALRPATGLDARRWRDIVGVRLTRDVPAGQPFLLSDIEGCHENRPIANVA